MVGMARRKEYFMASTKFKPEYNPPIIVIRALLVPGIMERDWKEANFEVVEVG